MNSSSEHERDIEALLALVADAPRLAALEDHIGQFNLFEAIGMVSQEIRHSEFLAYLFDPKQNHGLGDLFLKRVLREICPAELASKLCEADLLETQVLREWRNIDILVINKCHQLTVVIENKIYTGEHSDQLRRCEELIEQSYQGWENRFVLLSLSRIKASHPRYTTLTYSQIAIILQEIVNVPSGLTKSDVITVLTHYVQMLRRRHLGDTEIADLCIQLYSKHKRAIDLIMQYLPSQQNRLQEELVRLIEQTDGLVVYSVDVKKYVHFGPISWDGLTPMIPPDSWSSSGRNLMFVFGNFPGSLTVHLQIRRGPLAERQRLRDIALKHQPLFTPDPLKDEYIEIYRRTMLSPEQYKTASLADLVNQLELWWGQFVSDDLPKIESIYVTELSRS